MNKEQTQYKERLESGCSSEVIRELNKTEKIEEMISAIKSCDFQIERTPCETQECDMDCSICSIHFEHIDEDIDLEVHLWMDGTIYVEDWENEIFYKIKDDVCYVLEDVHDSDREDVILDTIEFYNLEDILSYITNDM